MAERTLRGGPRVDPLVGARGAAALSDPLGESGACIVSAEPDASSEASGAGVKGGLIPLKGSSPSATGSKLLIVNSNSILRSNH